MKQRLLTVLLLIGSEIDHQHANGLDENRKLKEAYNLLVGIIAEFE